MKSFILFAVLSVALVESAPTKDPKFAKVLEEAKKYAQNTLQISEEFAGQIVNAAKTNANIDQKLIVKGFETAPNGKASEFAFYAAQEIYNKEFKDMLDLGANYAENDLHEDRLAFIKRVYKEYPNQAEKVSQYHAKVQKHIDDGVRMPLKRERMAYSTLSPIFPPLETALGQIPYESSDDSDTSLDSFDDSPVASPVASPPGGNKQTAKPAAGAHKK